MQVTANCTIAENGYCIFCAGYYNELTACAKQTVQLLQITILNQHFKHLFNSSVLHWNGSQPSVKQREWGWACPNLRTWFSAGKGWSTHSGSGVSSCPKWRSSNISGSCSRVMRKESRKSTDGVHRPVVVKREVRGEDTKPLSLTGHFLNQTMLVLGWMPFCLQSFLKLSCHTFNKVLEKFLRYFGPHWHDSVTQVLQIYRLHIEDGNLQSCYIENKLCLIEVQSLWSQFEYRELIVMFKKSAWDYFSFVTRCVILHGQQQYSGRLWWLNHAELVLISPEYAKKMSPPHYITSSRLSCCSIVKSH